MQCWDFVNSKVTSVEKQIKNKERYKHAGGGTRHICPAHSDGCG